MNVRRARRSPLLHSQGGLVLMPVVLALVVVAAVALMLNYESATDVALVRGQAEQDTLRYVTEAGLAHAEWQLAQNTSCSGYTDLASTAFGSHSYSATIAPTDDSPVTIDVTGVLSNGATHSLNHEDVRVYDLAAPVTLTLQPGATGKDTFIEGDSGHTDHNKGGDNHLYSDSEADKQLRALLQFDLSVIPSTAHIQTATLELEVEKNDGSADTVEVHRLIRDWTEDGVTWDSYDGMQSWDTPGGDYDSQMSGSFLVDSTGWKSVDIASLAQSWVDGSLPNYGVILLSTPASGNNEKKYYSSDEGNATRHPKLTLTLSCECGQPCAMGGSTPTLWLSTLDDVTGSGAPGLDDWAAGEALVLTDPSFALEPASSGTLFSAFNLDDFAGDADIDAIHYVDSDLTVGNTSSVDLKAGDVLLSTADNETLSSINSLSVNDEDVFVFRPATPGDYSSGTFVFLLDGSQIHGESDTVGVSLVEKDTTVGDGSLGKGSFIFATTNRRDVQRFVADDVGAGTTSGHVAEFIDGPSLSLGSEIRGMDLAEDEVTIGGHTIPSGAILLTLNNDDTGGVGDNLVPADSADVFYLTVTQTGSSPIADATLLFEGLDISLDTSDEHLQALTLSHATSAGGAPSKIILSTYSSATLGGLTFTDKDLAEYNPATDTGALYLDGVAAGLAQDIDAIHVLENDHIVVSAINTITLGGVTAENEDLIDYDPATDNGTLVFDGSALFTSGSTDISAVHVLDNGHLLLTNEYAATLGGQSFGPNDIIDYDPSADTATLYFDGDAVGFTGWINALHLLENGHIVLSTNAADTLGGLSFSEGDFIEYDPVADIATLYFDGALFSAAENVRSVHIGPGSGGGGGGPIAHWKLDETSGSTAVDSEGGHDGTLVNGPSWTAGQLDGGLQFDGANDYVRVTHDEALSLDQDMTFTAWANTASISGGYQVILAKDDPGNGASNYWFGIWNDDLVFGYWADGGFRDVRTSASAGLTVGTWHHLAATFDDASNEVRLYLDGVEVQVGSLAWEPTTETVDLWIGHSVDGEYWDGRLDDVRIYDSVLEATEVAELAAAGGSGGGGGSCDGTYRDEFNSVSYANNDGTLPWSTDWLEVNESNGPTSGDERVENTDSDYHLQVRDNDGGGEGVQREADLSGSGSATFSFEYRRDGFDNSNDYVMVHVSDDGGSSWTELDRFVGPGTDSSYVPKSYDISAFATSNTRVRFLTSPDHGSGDELYVDDIEIECSP